jgi:hypothetical protein
MWAWFAGVAFAGDPVFGVGGHLGTYFLPGPYPFAFPPKIATYDFDKDGEGLADDVTGDGVPDATTLEAVRADVGFGADGFYWVGRDWRLGMVTNVDLGRRFTDATLLFQVDRSWDLDRGLLSFGGGLGFGYTRWIGADPDERLVLPSYPVRLQVGTVLPASDFVGIFGQLFGQMDIPSRHAYWDVTGAEREVSGIPFTYVTLGLQAGVLLGQFR